MLLIIILVILVLCLGGGWAGQPRYGYVGWSPLVIVLVLIALAYVLGYLPAGR